MDNERDKRGAPICPVCRDPFRHAESVVRVGSYMVHVPCVHEARRPVDRATPAALRPSPRGLWAHPWRLGRELWAAVTSLRA